MTEPTSAYARAGVDIEAGDRAVELMKEHARARRPEVLGDSAGSRFFDASAFKDYDHPVLATSTDGSAPRWPSHRRWTFTTRSAST